MPSILGFRQGKLQWIEGPERLLEREVSKERPDWEAVYRDYPEETLPWFQMALDQDLALSLDRLGLRSGCFLDLGTGTGTQALGLSELGFEVTASDISPSAIERARERARERELKIDFRVDDILKTRMQMRFDYILDRGCFHALTLGQQRSYVRALGLLLKSGGYFFLKCFSEKEEETTGPRRFTPREIRRLFEVPVGIGAGAGAGELTFEIVSLRETQFQNAPGASVKSLFCVMRLVDRSLS